MPDTAQLKLVVGETVIIEIRNQDEAGADLPFTATQHLRAQIRESYADPAIVTSDSLTPTGGIVIKDAPDDHIAIWQLEESETNLFQDLAVKGDSVIGDVELVDTSVSPDLVTRLFNAEFELDPNVTRA